VVSARQRASRGAGNLQELSPRELECLSWCAAGKTAWETSQILGISEWTVVYHLEKLKRRLGISRKHQLVAEAANLGLSLKVPELPAKPTGRT
jgi:DNA-binding CsgD family transcriptional regulator